MIKFKWKTNITDSDSKVLKNEDFMTDDLNCYNDSQSKGEYFSLDLNEWEEIHYEIFESKRLSIGRQHYKKEVRIFIQKCKSSKITIVDNFIMFDRKLWTELRRVRGDNKGFPLDINQNGTIWFGDRFEGCSMKIFVKR